MADLDDFFAKKDRKKSKSKKFATTDEVAKKLEDTTKKVEKPAKKEKIPESDETGQESHEQDEWRDFEEEKKDYTGLKIGNLALNQDNSEGGTGSENNMEQSQTIYDETGNEVEKKIGPWKKINNENAEQAAPKVEEKKIEVATPNVVGGAYVPPNKRNQPAAQTLQPTKLRSKTAPDIHNEEYFPTLSGGSKEQKRGRNEGSFELVAHSKSNSLKYVEQSKQSAQGPKLSLGNRYDTLSNDS